MYVGNVTRTTAIQGRTLRMSYEFPTKTSLRQEIYTKMVAIWQRVAGYTPPLEKTHINSHLLLTLTLTRTLS